jgi:hypothetical protein
MYSSQDGFDPIGIIVDWFDACREGRLAALNELYDDGAIVDCCQGGTFRGRLGVERYGRPRLAHPRLNRADRLSGSRRASIGSRLIGPKR